MDVGPSTQAGNRPPSTPGLPDRPELPDHPAPPENSRPA
jgi:hypothetical protein